MRTASILPIFQTMMFWEEDRGWGDLEDGMVGLQAVSEDDEDGDRNAKFEILLNMRGPRKYI